MAEPTPAFLGVEKSVTERRWRARADDERSIQTICQRFGVPDLLSRVIVGRGIGPDGTAAFLDPTLRDAMPDPSSFRDMDQAAARLAEAVRNHETIAVFGDYDVDGATSAALLLRFLFSAGADTRAYIPDRLTEGYGPNAAALERLAADGATVVVTVDCGITAFDALDAGAAAGLDIIVVDHHQAEPQLPTAVAVVNPNRLDESGGHGNLAAVGVAFLLAVAVNRALRQAGWYADRAEPDLRQWLDLVALGTVCDVVALTGLNRVFVRQGLKAAAAWANPGLKALAAVAGVRERPSTYHLGFLLGPRVNAGGRIGESELGVRLLTTGDPQEARMLAEHLDRLNDERRALEAAVLDAAVERLERMDGQHACPVVAAPDWHPGVLGIVASRLRERAGLPVFAIGIDGGVGAGSGRSIHGVDLGAAVIAARQAGLLQAGGGHAMAAGLKVAADRLPDLQAFLDERLADAVAQARAGRSLGIDGALTPGAATPDLLDLLDQAAPYGAGNAEPRFALAAVRPVHTDIVGQGHVRCVLAGAGEGRLSAIAFRAADRPLGQALLADGAAPRHVAGALRANDWRGQRRVQLVVDDVAWPAPG